MTQRKANNVVIWLSVASAIAVMLGTASVITTIRLASADHDNKNNNSTNTGTYSDNTTGTTTTADLNETGVTTTVDNETGTVVWVGRGNLTVAYNEFFPQQVEISAGESITFINPTPELHNVIFDLSNGTIISDLILPFSISNATEFELQPPYNLGEPVLEPGDNETQTLITLNKVAWVPAVVDSAGNITYLSGKEVSYNITGDEQVVSSGIMLPTIEELEAMFTELFGAENATAAAETTTEENVTTTTTTNNTNTTITETEQPSGTANATETAAEEEEPWTLRVAVNEFTVTFEEPGTYDFFCAFHPAMFGQVVVNGNATGTATTTTNNATSPAT